MNPATEIVIYKDWAQVFGQQVRRPDRVSIKQWMDFWEKVTGRKKKTLWDDE
jgi:hypothetical protein